VTSMSTKRAFACSLCSLLMTACGGRFISDGAPDADASTADVVSESSSADGPSVTVDAGTPPSSDDASVLTDKVQCGNALCDLQTQVCCVTGSGQDAVASCVPVHTCDAGIAFSCSTALSCTPPQICCGIGADFSQGAGCQPPADTSCQTLRLCASDGECPQGETCKAAQYGFDTCQP